MFDNAVMLLGAAMLTHVAVYTIHEAFVSLKTFLTEVPR